MAYSLKKAFDLILASFLVITLLPFVIFLVLVYTISGNRPVFYIQERLGLQESKFNLIKFRTLDSSEIVPLEKRTFTLGNWLRKTGFDELPQLINVIRGEMSLVGPRPLLVEYLPYFTNEQKLRFSVKPGITGLAQVNGRTSIDWDKKLSLDSEYVNNLSIWLDIRIIVKTIGLIFSREDSSTEESFIVYCNRKISKTNQPSDQDRKTRNENDVIQETIFPTGRDIAKS